MIVFFAREMRCAINPAVGDERFIHLPTAAKALKLAVVGGGPGGMEAARIATLRGHRGRLEVAAAGGADRRSAKNAAGPMNQSREAHHSAWPLHSPEGG